METDRIVGHDAVVAHLARRKSRKRLPHALLFIGPEGIGKRQVALKLARAILCQNADTHGDDGTLFSCGNCVFCEAFGSGTHPDFLSLMPEEGERGEIPIRDIRELRRALTLRSGFGGQKVVVIDEAHRMTHEAANAFLKTLEEPKGDVLFLLISHHPQAILSTIRSRTEILSFRPVRQQEIAAWLAQKGLPRERAVTLARLSLGRPGRASMLAHEPDGTVGFHDAVRDLERLLCSPLADRIAFAEAHKDDDAFLAQRLNEWLLLMRDVLVGRLSLEHLLIFPREHALLSRLFSRYTFVQLTRAIRLGGACATTLRESTVQPRFLLEYFLLMV
ncbi:MAG: DNA polymerase III subunit delta' [Parcubacteria group bacterium]|nr:DNA polymerase III subunit delta' [Parcubacteria group bacterium]